MSGLALLREIGSEFWNNRTIYREKRIEGEWAGETMFLSGRSAMAAIAEDLKSLGKNSIYMPSYACGSMVEPFASAGMRILFYDVHFNGDKIAYGVDFSKDFDALFIMQYFGYWDGAVFGIASKAKGMGRLVVEDATHSFFQEEAFSAESDYVFASLRKWCAVPGGAACRKRAGRLATGKLKENKAFAQKRMEAARIKESYMQGNDTVKKETFLRMFREAEEELEKGHAGCVLCAEHREMLFHIDWGKMAERRRKNAKFLLERLKGVQGIHLLHKELGEGDVPLCVPLLLGERDGLRDFLIGKQIYCPVHWPACPSLESGRSPIGERELSLPCDQRYGEGEMQYICDSIMEWSRKGEAGNGKEMGGHRGE